MDLHDFFRTFGSQPHEQCNTAPGALESFEPHKKMEKEKVWLLHFEKKQNVRQRKHQMPQKGDICAWPFLALCRTQEFPSPRFFTKSTHNPIHLDASVHPQTFPNFHRQKVSPFQPSIPIWPKFSTHASATFLCAFPPSFLPFTLLCSMFMPFQQFAASSILRTVRSLSLVNIRTNWKWPLLLVQSFFSQLCVSQLTSLAGTKRRFESNWTKPWSHRAMLWRKRSSGAAEVESSEEPKTEECLLSWKIIGRFPELLMISHDLALCSQPLHCCIPFNVRLDQHLMGIVMVISQESSVFPVSPLDNAKINRFSWSLQVTWRGHLG